MKRSLVVFVNGKNLSDIVPVKKSELERALSDFNPGSKVVMVLKSYYRDRDLSQNNVFYAYVTHIANSTGMSRTEVENELKNKYGIKTAKIDIHKNQVYDEKGNSVFINKSLSKYNVAEMSEFLDKIYGGMKDDFSIELPEPKKYAKINFEI